MLNITWRDHDTAIECLPLFWMAHILNKIDFPYFHTSIKTCVKVTMKANPPSGAFWSPSTNLTLDDLQCA